MDIVIKKLIDLCMRVVTKFLSLENTALYTVKLSRKALMRMFCIFSKDAMHN